MEFMGKPYRNLIREMTFSQFAVRDQNSVLGLLWSFLNPVLMVAVMFAYFRMSAGRDVKHYGIYLLLGMIHYTHFSNTTSTAMGSLTSMAQLTRHTILPKETVVIGSVIATSLEFAVSMVFCLILACFSGIPVTAGLIALPLIMVLQLIFVMWVSFLLSATRVFVKDLAHVYQVFLRILFFTTPIFYAAAFLRSPLAQRLLRFNPLAHLIGFSRGLVIDGNLFPIGLFLLLLAIHSLALWGAFRWFKHTEPRFAEYV
jgi:ABC-type polysaccharide/polyol phosphate export permease